ncbi:MAG: hypothetical protein Q8K36_04480, partial [Alphaproteobacteria bacterium]|nr:hypothetical protein [Alphaproteobacteria bacterium]
MSKFIKSLILIVASLMALIGSLQIQVVQHAIIEFATAKLQPEYKIKVIQPKGFWPLQFSADSIDIQTPDMHITLDQCLLTLNIKSLLTLQPKIDHLHVAQTHVVFLKPTEGVSTDYDVNALLKSMIAIMGQSYVYDVRLEKILINNIHSCPFSCFYQPIENGALFTFGLLGHPALVHAKIESKEEETFLDMTVGNSNHSCMGNVFDPFLVGFPDALQNRFQQLKSAKLSAHMQNDDIEKLTGKMSLSTEFEDGILEGQATLESGRMFDVTITNNAPISHEFFGQLDRLHAKGSLNQDALLLDTLNLSTSRITALFQGHIKGDFSNLHTFESEKIKAVEGTLKLNGEMLQGIFDQQNCSLEIHAKQETQHINGQIQLTQGHVALPLIGQYLQWRKPIVFEWHQGLKLSMDAIHGNTYILESNQDLSDLKLTVKSNANHSIIENGQINATIQNEFIGIKGQLKPRGSNNTFLVDLRTNTDFTMWNGMAHLKIEDMPPITTPFDFATVGEIDAHFDAKNYDVIKRKGQIDIHMTSKYFRSPIFKTERTTLKGSLLGSGDITVQHQTNMLAIGKQFLAQTAGFGVTGNIHKQTAFSIEARSHKIGYLSSPVRIDIQGHMNWPDEVLVIEKFHSEHLKQSLVAKKPFQISMNPLMVQDVSFDAGKGTLSLNHLGQQKGGAWSGTMALQSIPVGLLNWFLYKTVLVGTLNGSVILSGKGDQPDVIADIKASGVQWGKLHAFTPGVEETLSADLSLKKVGELFTWNSQLKGKGMANLQTHGSMQFASQLQSPLQFHMKGYLDLSLISAIIATGDRLCGKLNCDLSVDGSMARPILKGSIKADHAYVELAEFGTIINNISAQIVATGSRLV